MENTAAYTGIHGEHGCLQGSLLDCRSNRPHMRLSYQTTWTCFQIFEFLNLCMEGVDSIWWSHLKTLT
uniref:Uncharacterized protein n=1 Tax=Arion vulgaris TaxID=1028688 RepID=A0A0B7AY83_9EUPU